MLIVMSIGFYYHTFCCSSQGHFIVQDDCLASIITIVFQSERKRGGEEGPKCICQRSLKLAAQTFPHDVCSSNSLAGTVQQPPCFEREVLNLRLCLNDHVPVQNQETITREKGRIDFRGQLEVFKVRQFLDPTVFYSCSNKGVFNYRLLTAAALCHLYLGKPTLI